MASWPLEKGLASLKSSTTSGSIDLDGKHTHRDAQRCQTSISILWRFLRLSNSGPLASASFTLALIILHKWSTAAAEDAVRSTYGGSDTAMGLNYRANSAAR